MIANEKHEAFFQEFSALLGKHLGELDASEMLAVASNCVGKILALQDQRKFTSNQAMQIIMNNISLGNEQMIESLLNTKGNA